MYIRRRKKQQQKSKSEADVKERHQKEGAIAAERGLRSISNNLSCLRFKQPPAALKRPALARLHLLTQGVMDAVPNADEHVSIVDRHVVRVTGIPIISTRPYISDSVRCFQFAY